MDEEIKTEEIEEEKTEEKPDSGDAIEAAAEEVISDALSLVEVADMIGDLERKLSDYFERISELLLKSGAVVEVDTDDRVTSPFSDDDIEYVPIDELDLKF